MAPEPDPEPTPASSRDDEAARDTIDELAQRSGFTARNIRTFQMHGMLPGPIRRGRLGYYGPEHLTRLRLIGQLQADGFSRAAIASLMQAWDSGRSLGEVLGFEEQLSTLLPHEENPRISLYELAAIYGPAFDALETAMEIGLLVPIPDTDQFEVANQTLLDIGTELFRAGIPLPVVMEQSRYVRELGAEIARHFVSMFLAEVWEPFVARGFPEDELEGVTAFLRQFEPLIVRSLEAAVDEAMGKEVARVLHEISESGSLRGE